MPEREKGRGREKDEEDGGRGGRGALRVRVRVLRAEAEDEGHFLWMHSSMSWGSCHEGCFTWAPGVDPPPPPRCEWPPPQIIVTFSNIL